MKKEMPLNRLHKENGFTLIEVMLATLLIGIAFLAIASGEITIVTLNKRTSEGMKARAAGEYIVELIRRNPDNVIGYHNFSTDSGDKLGTTVTGVDFNNWKNQISMGTSTRIDSDAVGRVTVAPGPMPGMDTVNVMIDWQFDNQGVPQRSVNFNTVILCNPEGC